MIGSSALSSDLGVKHRYALGLSTDLLGHFRSHR